MTKDKSFEELTPNEMSEMKIEFAPGCFDNFEGTQEELDELVAEIHRLFSTGEAQKLARPIDFDDPSEDDLETIEHLMQLEQTAQKRNLQ